MIGELKFSNEEMMKFINELCDFFEERRIPPSHAAIIMAECLATVYRQTFLPEHHERMAENFKQLLLKAINLHKDEPGLTKDEAKRLN